MGAEVAFDAPGVVAKVMALLGTHPRTTGEESGPLFAAELTRKLIAVGSPQQGWLEGSRYLIDTNATFEANLALYDVLSTSATAHPLAAWVPDEDATLNSNLAAFLRKRGIPNYQRLHAWSVAEPEAYWEASITELGLTFDRPPAATRGAPDDFEQPRWLDGAQLNLARACLLGAESAPALIVAQGDSLHTLTRGQLRHRVEHTAMRLAQLGVAAGDSIAMAIPLGVEAVTFYLALLHLGAVVVCIAESYSVQELGVRLEISAPQWVVTAHEVRRSGKVLPLYDKFVRVGAPRAIVVERTQDDGALRDGDIDWSTAFNSAAQPPVAEFVSDSKPHPTPIEATCTVLFSSGTTGAPKAIPWNPSCAIKAAVDAKWHLDVRTGDRLIWPTSLGWMMGAWSIFATLLNGAALLIFDDAPTHSGFGKLVQKARATHVGVIPSLVRAWRETRVMEGFDWSHVRLFSSTGECSNRADMLYLMWLAGYRPIVEYCGGTEIAGGYITSSLLAPCAPSCFTTAALGQSFVVLDEAGREAREGEAFLCTPSLGLSTSLLNKDHHEEYFANTPRQQVRRHGDLVERADADYFRVLGRADDTMNLGGIKVSSAELERACQDIPGVKELAAIALSPPVGGPSLLVLCAVLYDSAAADVDPASAIQRQAQLRVRERVNPLFKVERVVLTDALPRTASNKVMRRELRKRYVNLFAPASSGAVGQLPSNSSGETCFENLVESEMKTP